MTLIHEQAQLYSDLLCLFLDGTESDKLLHPLVLSHHMHCSVLKTESIIVLQHLVGVLQLSQLLHNRLV